GTRRLSLDTLWSQALFRLARQRDRVPEPLNGMDVRWKRHFVRIADHVHQRWALAAERNAQIVLEHRGRACAPSLDAARTRIRCEVRIVKLGTELGPAHHLLFVL